MTSEGTQPSFDYDSLQGRLDCPNTLERINGVHRTLQINSVLRLPSHRTNYSMLGAIKRLQKVSMVASVFDFDIRRRRFSSPSSHSTDSFIIFFTLNDCDYATMQLYP